MKHKSKKTQKKSLMQELLSRYGETIIWSFKDSSPFRDEVETLATDSMALNWSIAGTGFPRGRLTELYGPESSGKTTICYHVIACCQRAGKAAAFVDVENSLDPVYASRCGVDVKNLIIAQPDYGEQALSIVEDLIHDGRPEVIVLDSVAQLSPKAEIEGDLGDVHMGLQARMITQSMRRLAGMMKLSRAAVIFTNQVRAKIGGYGFEDTPGGRSLRHHCSVIARVSRSEKIIMKGKEIGYIASVDVKKNKIVSPFRKVQFPILYGQGLETRLELVNLALKAGVVSKRGSHYYLGKKKRSLGSGWLSAYSFLSSPKIEGKVKESILRYLDNQTVIFGENSEN